MPEAEAAEARAQAEAPELLARLAGFARALREHGLPVGSDDVTTFCSAMAELTVSDLADLYWAGRSTLVHSRRHLAVYDEVFRSWFLGVSTPAADATVAKQAKPSGSGGTLNVPDSEPGEQPDSDDTPMMLGLEASPLRIERRKRFEACSEDELAALRRIIARIRLEPPRRRSRRRCPSHAGAVLDIRRMTRDAMRLGEPSPQLHRLQRKTRARPLVLILDVSGSMADYSRNLLQFAYSMRQAAQKVEVFCFGTRLTRITPALDRRSPDDAMRLAAERVLDWDGGTRIGESLDDFVRNWGRRGLSRGAAGTMTGFAFTEILVAVFDAWRAGDQQRATRIFDKYLPLIRFENQPVVNLGIRKELLRRRGALACATPRQPFAPLDAGTLAEIDWVFARVGISDPTRKLDLNGRSAS